MSAPMPPEARVKFLELLRACPNVARAARGAGWSPRCFRDWREKDAQFAKDWDDALEEAIQVAEGAVHDRAFIGVEKPVYQGGMEVGTVREYSDSLAQFLLKAHRPDRYRERTDVNLSGGVQLQVISGVPQPGEDLI